MNDIPWGGHGGGSSEWHKRELERIIAECRQSRGADGNLPPDAAEIIWRLFARLHTEADAQVVSVMRQRHALTREHKRDRRRANRRAAAALSKSPVATDQLSQEKAAWDAVDTTGRDGVGGRPTGLWRAACLRELAYLWIEGLRHFNELDLAFHWTPTTTPSGCFGRVGAWLLNLPRAAIAPTIAADIAQCPEKLQAQMMIALRPAWAPRIDELRPNDLQAAIEGATRRPHGEFANFAQAAAWELTPIATKRALKQAIKRKRRAASESSDPQPTDANPAADDGGDPVADGSVSEPEPVVYVAIQLADGRWIDIETGEEIDPPAPKT